MTRVQLAAAFLVMLLVISLLGFWAGMKHCQEKAAQAQVKVLHRDSKKSLELEATDVTRKAKTEASVRVIHASSDDCGRSPAPTAVLDQLR